MIENQIISYILQTKSLAICVLNAIDESYFVKRKAEYSFIVNHKNTFGSIPDKETFLAYFPEFDLFDIGESEKYLVQTIKELYLFRESQPILNNFVGLLKKNSNEALHYLRAEIPRLTRDLYISGVNLIKEGAESRFNDFVASGNIDSSKIIPTGDPHLDNLIHGYYKGEDFVTVVGRTKQGKSFLLLKMLIDLWRQGKRIVLYSGEMSANIVGYRLDTILSNISNTALMTGDKNYESKYRDFVSDLRKCEVPFIVVTKEELGGRATVSKLDAFVEKYNGEILGVDQLPLVDDERRKRGDDRRARYENIVVDFLNLSVKRSVPVLCATQANRGVDEGECPELINVAEADLINHYSTRILSMCHDSNILKIKFLGGRYGGKEGKSIYYNWNIDEGIYDYIPDYSDISEDDKYSRRKETKKYTDVF